MSSAAPPQTSFSISTRGTVLVHLDFLLTGIVMTFLGPMLPILSARWNLNDERAGYLSFSQFLSSMFGMLLSGVLVGRVGYRATFIIGLVTMASGMTLLASGPFHLGILAVCIFGFGHGITTPAGNLRIAEINSPESAAALNVINAVWGIGAMIAPFLVALAQRAHRHDLFLYGTAAALLVLLFPFLFVRLVPDIRTKALPAPHAKGLDSQHPGPDLRSVLRLCGNRNVVQCLDRLLRQTIEFEQPIIMGSHTFFLLGSIACRPVPRAIWSQILPAGHSRETWPDFGSYRRLVDHVDRGHGDAYSGFNSGGPRPCFHLPD